jgi:alpha-1,2-mannosyltransferase
MVTWHQAGVRLLTRRWALLLFAASAAAHLTLMLLHPAHFVDASVYRAEALALREGSDLYDPLPVVHGLSTYPPFAAVVFLPLLLVPSDAIGVLSAVGNVGLLLGVCYLSLDLLGVGRVDLHVAAPLLAAVALWAEPVTLTIDFGQINLLILGLVLWDFGLPERSRWRGLGVGLAAAVKVTPGIFIVYLVLTGRLRAAAVAVATLLATVAVSTVLAPGSTWAYWTRHLFDLARVGRLENSMNQSVLGWVVRSSHTVDAAAASPAITAVVLVLGTAAAVYCHRGLGDAWGVLVAALTALLASPFSWSHHWVWCVPLIALAWYEARVLVLPTLVVFWSYVAWWVPHGDGVELRLTAAELALSGVYVAYAVLVVIGAVIAARRRPAGTPTPAG